MIERQSKLTLYTMRPIQLNPNTHTHTRVCIFEIQCNNNGMAWCQKQSSNQRPLPICSAGSGGILNQAIDNERV